MRTKRNPKFRAETGYPLDWPDGWARTPDDRRKNAGFHGVKQFEAVRDNLFEELRKLGANNVAVTCNVRTSKDGQISSQTARRNANGGADDPGVSVWFELHGQEKVIARDAHPTIWENMHSLGTLVRYMRGVQQHGGDVMLDRAFAGFAALPPPEYYQSGGQAQEPAHDPSKRPWYAVLGMTPEEAEGADKGDVMQAYRILVKEFHTDTDNGDHDVMVELNRAKQEGLQAVANH